MNIASMAVRVGLALAAILFVNASVTTSARAEGTWCIYEDWSLTNCGFYTQQQCLASASGVGGLCVPNPRFMGAPSYAYGPQVIERPVRKPKRRARPER